MTPEVLKNTRFFRFGRSAYDKQKYPNGQPFSRLTLTLSAKGWTSSIQWKGTCGSRGVGSTIEEAIEASLDNLAKWKSYVVVDKQS